MNKDLQHYSKEFTFYLEELQIEINSIGYTYLGTQVDLQKEVFLTILNRIGVNISSIKHLSKVFDEENVSSSIALLFRSCISDIILAHYLLMYKSDINSFSGEVKIKETEFLRYIIKVSPMEQEMLSESEEDLKIRNEQLKQIIIGQYSNLIEEIKPNGNFKIKKNETIRLESNSKRELFGEWFSKNLSEDNMFERLLNHKSEYKNYYKSIYILWRYFAQFQHYSFSGRHFIAEQKADFLYYFFQSMRDCYYLVHILMKDIFHLTFEGFDDNIKKVFILLDEYKPQRM